MGALQCQAALLPSRATVVLQRQPVPSRNTATVTAGCRGGHRALSTAQGLPGAEHSTEGCGQRSCSSSLASCPWSPRVEVVLCWGREGPPSLLQSSCWGSAQCMHGMDGAGDVWGLVPPPAQLWSPPASVHSPAHGQGHTVMASWASGVQHPSLDMDSLGMPGGHSCITSLA